ncbi:MAG: hypothetical protein HOP28_12175 [Gemmatimonadales bacterium]|nr:hypothetical protein [Gemmatimonadales bacterium]
MPTPTELLQLAQEESFVARVTVAFASVAYASLSPTEGVDPEIRKKQLEAARRLANPAQARELAKSSMTFILGAAAVQSAGAEVTDEALIAVVQTVAAALTEYATLGGAL